MVFRAKRPVIRWFCLILAGVLIGICSPCYGFSVGSGVPDDPYQIATFEDLLLIGSDPDLLDKHYILVADIDLDPNALGGQAFSQAPINANFTGCFNGNHHTIHNLNINSDDYSVGLFRSLGKGSIVENLWIENTTIYSDKYYVGGLAAKNWGTIRKCHVSGKIYGFSSVGGLVGRNGYQVEIRSNSNMLSNDTLITNEEIEGVILSCSSNVDVTATRINVGVRSQNIGGIVGLNAGGIIGLCKSSGSINGDIQAGGLVGDNKGWIYNCYSDCNVQGIKFAGGLIGENSGSVMMCYSTGMVSGETRLGGLIGDNYNGSTHLSYWDIQASGLDFSSGGRGKTTEQLKNIQTFRGWGYDDVWTLDDGNDYPRLAWENTPGNLIIDTPPEYAGGTGDVNDPYQIKTAEQLLALGYYWPDFNDNFILMQDIDFNDIDPNIIVSIGIPAFPYSGIFDGNNNTISNFKNYNDLENYVGMFGSIGPNSVVKDISILIADIKGYNNSGILAGSNEGLIQNCFVSGCIDGYGYVGGLVGYNEENAVINLCSSDVDVNGISRVGGLVGQNYIASICMSDSFAIVTASGESVGGLVGLNFGDIERCYSHGWITGVWGTGGLVGSNDTHVSFPDCGKICDSYANVIVEGERYVGGLIGYHRGTSFRSYSTGMVSGSENIGGLIGRRDTSEGLHPASAIDCYWDVQTSGQQSSQGGERRTTFQMKQQDNYTNWDFAKVWDIVENQTYPFLRWPITGDINGDCKVDFDDLMILMAYWLQDCTPQD